MEEYLVSEIMKKQVITVDSSMTVKDVAKIMEDANVGCVVVMEDNTAVGIVTEKDFVRRMVARDKPGSTNVKTVMSSPLIVAGPTSSVWEVAELMKLRKIRKIPIVDQGRLVGIITSTDIVKLCSIGSDSEVRRVMEQILDRMNRP